MVTIKELEFHFKSSIDVIQFNCYILMCLHNFLQHIKITEMKHFLLRTHPLMLKVIGHAHRRGLVRAKPSLPFVELKSLSSWAQAKTCLQHKLRLEHLFTCLLPFVCSL